MHSLSSRECAGGGGSGGVVWGPQPPLRPCTHSPTLHVGALARLPRGRRGVSSRGSRAATTTSWRAVASPPRSPRLFPVVFPMALSARHLGKKHLLLLLMGRPITAVLRRMTVTLSVRLLFIRSSHVRANAAALCGAAACRGFRCTGSLLRSQPSWRGGDAAAAVTAAISSSKFLIPRPQLRTTIAGIVAVLLLATVIAALSVRSS